ncbi:Hydroxyisourate hydrolase [Morus notabilis]|uniref:Hydroxyisourate hydrolase n=1 Tax=Morus notabilis TaxID=981085 RepID=W9RGV8_9ROSA|nr:Hydroxyisourate hydrolase [Morus notabilis]
MFNSCGIPQVSYFVKIAVTPPRVVVAARSDVAIHIGSLPPTTMSLPKSPSFLPHHGSHRKASPHMEGAANQDGEDSEEDVQLIVKTGLDAFRFSISWSRLIPRIQPHVTLHHSDLSQVLEDEYGGWVSRKFMYVSSAIAGSLPPKLCSRPLGVGDCSTGNSSTEPYTAAHHMLLAHASVARLYEKNYKDKQQGFVGINIFAYWFIPLTDSNEDKIATQRANDFYIVWIELLQCDVKDKSSTIQSENRDVIADMGVKLYRMPLSHKPVQNDPSIFEFDAVSNHTLGSDRNSRVYKATS